MTSAPGPAARTNAAPPTGNKARHPGNQALGSSMNAELTTSALPHSDAQCDAKYDGPFARSAGNGRSANIAPTSNSHMRDAGE